jgi:hypothetical protein
MSAPEDHEDVMPEGEEDDEFDMDDGEEGIDLMDALSSLLTTDEGDNLATVLDGIKTQLEMQNKILVKIFGVLNKAA